MITSSFNTIIFQNQVSLNQYKADLCLMESFQWLPTLGWFFIKIVSYVDII